MFSLYETAEACVLVLARLDVLVAARAENDPDRVRVVDPFAIFVKCFCHMD